MTCPLSAAESSADSPVAPAEREQHIEVALQLRRGEFELHVNERFPCRGVTALFGPSGCGKSTLLRAMAGLESAARGRVSVGGAVWQDDGRKLRLTPQRRRVGLVFQRANLFPHLSVAGNLYFGRRRRRNDTANGVARNAGTITEEAVLHWLDLRPLLHRPVHALSGGEQQRVAIGRALLSQPDLLLLDEPLSGVDVARRRHILPFLERLHQSLRIPIILVSHQVEEVARLADRVLFMQHGRIAARGGIFSMLRQLSGAESEPYALLPGQVTAVDAGDHLSAVNTPAGELWVPGTAVPVGRALRLVVKASNISLSAAPLTDVSILNQLPARISHITERDNDQLIGLDAGGVALVARVSHRAVRRMALAPGRPVYAMIKSVSVLTAGEAEASDLSGVRELL